MKATTTEIFCCRSEASDSPVVEESAPAGSAEPASIGSLIQKFERANQADPHVCLLIPLPTSPHNRDMVLAVLRELVGSPDRVVWGLYAGVQGPLSQTDRA
jgi:hypothetical protein